MMIAVAGVAALVAAILVLRMSAISIVVIRDEVGAAKSPTPQSTSRDLLDAAPGSPRSTAPNQIDTGPGAPLLRSAASDAIPPEPATPLRPLLVTASQRASLQTDQVWPLGLRTTADSSAGMLVVKGLTAGAKLSVGRPTDANGWELSAGELDGAAVIPPPGFVGAMDLAIELRLGDVTVDQQSMRIEWLANTTVAAPQVPIVRMEPGEVNRLLGRGRELLAGGEIAAARAVFKRLADTGEPRAAFALAESYEQSTLDRLGAKGLVPDTSMARTWYEKARELGSTAAQRRLDVLVGQSK
jgi:hypothetical protein